MLAGCPPAAEWKAPPPSRLRTILDRLREEYGRPNGRPHGAPIDELVLTVLSQNTNDRNRDVAYGRLRERFPSWAAVREAPVDEVEEAIRPGGLAPSKAPRIQEILRAIGDDDLSRLADEPLEQARAELCELPGVGRKTAACVLLFSFGRPDIPVDTHVYRVGTRLGLFRPERPAGRGSRRDAAAGARLRSLRGAHGADPPRAPRVLRALARLPRVPAAADVPVRARDARARRGERARRRTPGRRPRWRSWAWPRSGG